MSSPSKRPIERRAPSCAKSRGRVPNPVRPSLRGAPGGSARRGLIDLSFLGKLEIAGPDAREFLHRIASADLSGLKPGQGAASYVLSAQGKIQHSFEALATPDGFLVIAEGSAVPALIQDLETFRFGEKVGYRDFTNDLGALLLCGPNAEAILRAAAEGEPPPASAERSHTFLKIEGSSVLTVCD